MRRMPRKKFGSEMPISANVVLAMSATELRRIAAMIPAGMPIASATMSERKVSSSVTGNRLTIASNDRLMRANRVAEIAAQHIAEPAEILHRQRLIEAEIGSSARHRFRRRVVPQHQLDRIARRQMQHQEDRDADEEQHRNRRDQRARK